jgi:hypothetical protein
LQVNVSQIVESGRPTLTQPWGERSGDASAADAMRSVDRLTAALMVFGEYKSAVWPGKGDGEAPRLGCGREVDEMERCRQQHAAIAGPIVQACARAAQSRRLLSVFRDLRYLGVLPLDST